MKPFLLVLLTLATAASMAAVRAGTANDAPSLRVSVDPRVELLSLIFRLSGNPEYGRARVPAYSDDVEKQFSKFEHHRVVQLARKLRSTRGVSYDAVMGMAVHVSDAFDLQLKVPLSPWPESLDTRWTPQSASNFLAAAREFVRDTGFRKFIEGHEPLYRTTETRLTALMTDNAHLNWFPEYFGSRPQASFTVIPGLLNGGSCYGPHFRDAKGQEELFCVLGVWQTDSDGTPEFTTSMLGTVVHEFCHSYANPIVDRHLDGLRPPGQKLFVQVSDKMRSQAYGEASTMLRESLVRACVVRYLKQYEGGETVARAIRDEKQRGFLWIQELCDLLAEYEKNRQRYPNLDAFAPRLVSFFSEYAKDFATKKAAADAKRPTVVQMIPANGATDVDPELKEIRVTFDRPMHDQSWSMCGSGPDCPENAGKPHYDSARKTWTAPVRLKPDQDYEFSLNCPSYSGFQSEDGTPLEPVPVRFKTAVRP